MGFDPPVRADGHSKTNCDCDVGVTKWPSLLALELTNAMVGELPATIRVDADTVYGFAGAVCAVIGKQHYVALLNLPGANGSTVLYDDLDDGTFKALSEAHAATDMLRRQALHAAVAMYYRI